jgi:hypothetical protein
LFKASRRARQPNGLPSLAPAATQSRHLAKVYELLSKYILFTRFFGNKTFLLSMALALPDFFPSGVRPASYTSQSLTVQNDLSR